MAFAKGTQTFDFPPSIRGGSEGQHYMLIESYESKNATTTEGKKLSSIALYIPTGSLNTSFTGNYEDSIGGTAAVDKSGFAFKSGPQVVGEGALSAAGKALSALTATLAQGVVSGFGNLVTAQGAAPNNYLALVYNGPNAFREHTFAFKFFPKNVDESETVKSIIAEFQKGTLPRLGSVGGMKDSYFKSPRQHKIKFFTGNSENRYLFNIATSVITNMTINFDPQNVVGFHKDGQPVSIDLTMTFKEIELPISDDSVTSRGAIRRITGNQSQNTGDDENLNSVGLADI